VRHTFTVFKTATCPACHNALRFLEALRAHRDDVAVEVVDATVERQRFRRVAQRVGRSTVPQVFLDGHYVGGWLELAAAARSGRLDAFLCGEARQSGARPGDDVI
jgi:glutaredoxin 3